MTKEEKYIEYRKIAKEGDIILFHGHAVISKLIQYFDNAYYNHVAIVGEISDRILIFDANQDGVQPHFLSHEIEDYKDFDVIRPVNSDEEIQAALKKALDKAEISKLHYDFWALGRIALNRKFGMHIKYKNNSSYYCSEYGRLYTNFLNIKCYNNNNDISPNDFYLLLDIKELIPVTDFKMDK